MAGQQLYQERTGRAGIQMPGQVRVPAMPVDTRTAQAVTAIAGAAQQLGGILAREHAQDQRMRISESLLAARKEFSEWQAQYVQEHQGSNALSAGADFSAKMREIAQRHMAAFGGAGNEIFQRELGGQMAALDLRATEQGAAYAAQQRRLWENSVLEGMQAQILADAENDPGNGAWIDHQMTELGRMLSERGIDPTAPIMKLSSDVQLRRGLSWVQRGDLSAASALLQGWKSGPMQPWDISARYESGAEGSAAIGYDGTGGTSYGKFQLSSKQGSLDGFLRFLDGKGGDAAAVAQRLRAAGPADTGSRSGAMPEAWKQAAQTPGFAEWEHEFAQREFFDPAVRSLPAGAAEAVRQSPALQQMVWSTAVQHGAEGAAGIFKKVWRDGMTDADFVRAAYDERATRFGSSTPEVRASVQRRLRREADDILGGLSGAGGVNGMSLQAAMQLEGAIDRERSRQAVELRGQLADAEAALMAGEKDVPLPSDAVIMAAFGDKGGEVLQQLADARQYGLDVVACSSMTPEQQAAMIERHKPVPGAGYAVNSRRYDSLQKIVDADRKAREKDAPAYLVRFDDDVRRRFEAMQQSGFTPETVQAYAASLEVARQSRGMRSKKDAPFLPANAAASLTDAITENAEPVQMLASLSQSFGKAWPAVERQIVTSGKLPDALTIVASGMEPRAGGLLYEATRDKDFTKKAAEILGYNNTDVENVSRKLRSELEPMLKTFNAQGAFQRSESLVRNATILALQYRLRSGYGESDAVSLAAQEIGKKRYSYNGTYRIPSGYDPDLIARGLAFAMQGDALKTLAAQAAGLQGVKRDDVQGLFVDSLRRSVTPVTMPDESGISLYLLDRPVMAKGGGVVSWTWQELAEFGKQAEKAKLERLSQGELE